MRGARLGDLIMSLIQTSRRAGVSSHDYLSSLVRYAEQVKADPSQWLPWNFQATIAALAPGLQ